MMFCDYELTIKIFLRSLTPLHVPETGSAFLESRESIAMH